MLANDLNKFVFLAGFSCLFASMGWANSAPIDINASNLTIAENSAIGTVIGEFNATDPDGDTNITFSLVPPLPSDLNLSLWLDASDASTITHSNGSVSQWADKSGNGNHAVQPTSNNMPILASDGLGGKSVIQFDGINDYITSSDLNITQSYSIFLVAKTNNNANGRDYLFDGVGDIDSHRSLIALDNGGTIQMWAGSWANSNFDTPAEAFLISAIFDGSNSSLSLNGTSVTGLNPSNYSLTNGIRIGANFLVNNDFLDGSIAEFIIVDESVSTVSQAAVEAYLAFKWGLQSNLSSDHSYLSLFSIDSNGSLTASQTFDYETDDLNYSIIVRATDDHNATFDKNFTITVTNVVEDMDGDGTEDHYDDDIDGDGLTNVEELAYNSDPWDASSGNRPPSDINASNQTIAENSAIGTIIGEFNATDPDGDGNFTFSLPSRPTISSLGKLKVWLDASESEQLSTSLTEKNPPASGNQIKKWFDLSGNGHHAESLAGTPTWSANSFNLKPGVVLNKASLVLNNSSTAFDGWNELTVVAAFYQPGDQNFATVFGKANYAGWMDNNKDLAWSVFTHRLDLHHNLWGPAIISGTQANIYLNANGKAFQEQENGAPGILVLSYNSGQTILKVNGQEVASSDALSGSIQSKPDLDVTIGGHSSPFIDTTPDGQPKNVGGLNNMVISEFMIFNDDLSVDNDQKIEGYLAHKWKVDALLPQDHSFKSERPFYKNNYLFTFDENSNLKSKQTFDYETDDRNYSITVRATDDHNVSFDKNFTITVTNVIEDLDGDGTEDHYDDDIDGDGLTNVEELAYNSDPWDASSSNRPPSDINTSSSLSIAENSAIGTVIGEFNATDPDGDGNFTFSVQSVFTDPSNISGLNAWFDASDISTIVTEEGSVDVKTWANKLDASVKMHSGSVKPQSGFSINGLNAISSDHALGVTPMIAKENNSTEWNPMGENGAASGTADDFSIFLAMRFLENGTSFFPFGLNFDIASSRSHFNWGGGGFYWRFSDTRGSFQLANEGTPFVLSLETSLSKGSQTAFYNGLHQITGTRDSAVPITGGFSFPAEKANAGDPANTSHTSHSVVGEILVVNEVISSDDRQKIEGYLASKWGLADQLPDSHLYAPNNLFSFDENGSLRTNRSLDYEVDEHNYTVNVEVLDDRNASYYEDFNITLTNVVEDLDGDGTEDHYDDDIDGDGLANAEELAYNSDPWDASSSNRPPSDINASNLNIAENSAIGTVIGEFNATDPDGEGNFTYDLKFNFPESSNPVFWMDASDSSTITQSSGFVSHWLDKSGNGNHLIQGNTSMQGRFVPTVISNMPAILFDGVNDNYKFQNSLSIQSIFMVLNTTETPRFTNWRWPFGGKTTNSNRYAFIFGSKDSANLVGNNLSLNGGISAGELSFANDQSFKIIYCYKGDPIVRSDWYIGLGDAYWKGHISEVISFSNLLSENLVDQVEAYLGFKWGLESNLPSEHSAKTFSVDTNGRLTANHTFDYETDDLNYSITVRATDDHNISFDKNFTVTVANVVEDLDGDGTEDYYDDDIDGDGLTNAEELAYNSDPWDASSSNRPPRDINTTSNLTIAENSVIGSVIGEFNATDPDGGEITFRLITAPEIHSPAIWFDASDETSIVLSNGQIKGWLDRSGNNRNASVLAGTPEYNQTAGPNNLPVIQLRCGAQGESGDEEFSIAGTFSLKDHFFLVRSPTSTWSDYGAIIGHGNGRGSNFLFERGKTYFHANQHPVKVSKNSTAIESATFDLGGIDEFMVLRIVVNDDSIGPHSNWKIGDAHGWSPSLDIAEIISFENQLSESEALQIEHYLATKWKLEHANPTIGYPFTLDGNGSLKNNASFDYETDDRNYSITVRATDDHNISFDKNFTITVTNVVEDLDGDGIEDHYDNPPSWIKMLGTTVGENQPAGTRVGQSINPLDVANLIWWSDASDESSLTRNTEGVTHWADKVNGWSFKQTSAGAIPDTDTTINGRQALFFDDIGANDFYYTVDQNDEVANPLGGVGTEVTDTAIFLVIRTQPMMTGSNKLFDLGAGIWHGGYWKATNRVITFSVSRDFPNIVNNNGSFFWIGGKINTSTSYIACYYNSVQESVQQIWLNGTMATGDTTGHKTTIESDSAHWKLCANNTAHQLGEVLVVNGGMSKEDRHLIEGYLAHRWNLQNTLPTEHPYKTSTAVSISSYDPDPNPVLTYSLVDGNDSLDNDLFTIDENGTLSTNASIDATLKPSANIRIGVTDEHNATTTQEFTIRVLKENAQTTGNISITGVPEVGNYLSVDTNLTDADGIASLSYQWLRNGTGPRSSINLPSSGPSAILVSANGSHMYVANSGSKTLALYDLNTTTGELFLKHTYSNNVNGNLGLYSFRNLHFGPDESFIYVIVSNGVAWYSRNQTSGLLNYRGILTDYTNGDGMGGASEMVFSSNGANAYLVSNGDDAITRFNRNTTTGALSYQSTMKDSNNAAYGMDGASNLVISPDSKHLYASATNEDSINVFTRNTSNGTISYTGKITDGINGVNGLNGASDMVISADGKFIYALAPNDSAISWYSRNLSTGGLSYLGVLKDGVSGVDGLDGGNRLMFVANESYLLVSSIYDDAIARFSRNATTGMLTYDGVLKNSSLEASILDAPNGFALVEGISRLYVSASHDNAIGWYDLNSSSASLTYAGVYTFSDKNISHDLQAVNRIFNSKDGNFSYLFDGGARISWHKRDLSNGGMVQKGAIQGTGNGLKGIADLAFSADQKFVYIANKGSDSISWYSRDSETGVLQFINSLYDGVHGVDGLAEVCGVRVSKDGENLYAIGYEDNSISWFDLNKSTGAITYKGLLRDGVSGVDGMEEPFRIEMHPNDSLVYVISEEDDAIAYFSRNSSGDLSFKGRYFNQTQLDDPRSFLISNDGQSLYAGASPQPGHQGNRKIVRFSLNDTSGSLTYKSSLIVGQDGVFGFSRFLQSSNGLNFYSSGSGLSIFDINQTSGDLSYVKTILGGLNDVRAFGSDIQFSHDESFLYAAGGGLSWFDRNVTGGELSSREANFGKDGNYFLTSDDVGQEISVTVYHKDGGGVVSTHSVVFEKEIRYPNNIPTSLDINSSEFSENQPSGTLIGKFSALDLDQDSVLAFSFSGGETFTDNTLFNLTENGELRTKQTHDYETDDQNFTIRVRVSDERKGSIDGNFTILLLNVVEDNDQDGVEDHYDPDDDNDGFSDADELAYGSDHLDPNSVPNSAPLDLNASNVLTISENQPVGTLIGEFNATDPDGDDITYHFVSGDNNNSFFTLDTNGTLKSGVSFDYESNASTYTITVQAKDELNASVEGNFTITLLDVDDEKPVIELAGDSNITHEAGSFYTDQNATWADNVDGDGNLTGTGEVNASNPGIYYLTYNYTDGAGNVAQTVTRTVNVVDRTAPVITLSGDSNITHEAGKAYEDANATWTDAVDGRGVISAVGEVDTSTPGTYILSFDYTDAAGNAAQTVKRTINVVDKTAPVITLRGAASVSQLVGRDFTDAGATWYDVVDGEGEAQVTGEVLTDILGTYELIYSHTDQAGNHAVKVKRIVRVVNTPPTELVSQSPLSVLENQPVGTLVGSFTSQSDNINSRLVYRLVESDTPKDSFFNLDENGTLRTATVFDFETDEKQYEIEVEVAEQFGASQSRSFTVDLVNMVEDLDGDGIEDFYDDDIDGDGFTNETELAEGTNPRDPFSASMQPILKTISGYLDRNGSIMLRGRVKADGDGKVTDFGFVLSSKAVMSRSAGKDIWIRGEGNVSNFTLQVDENPFDGDLYFRAWAKNVAGYGVGSVKKVVFEMEPARWWGQTEEFDGGWQVSPWFGAFRAYEDGWLYHARLGWLYSKEAPEQSVWLWQESRGWLWTQEEIWPYLWSNRTSDWIYFFPSKAGELVYLFDQATGTAEPLK